MGPVDPVMERVEAAPVTGPVGLLLSRLGSPESRKMFRQWSDDPMTRLIISVVRELALRGPAHGLSTDSYVIQHGLTVGLGIAAQLMDDPSLLFPALFSGQTSTGAQATESFSTSQSDLMDMIPDEGE